MAEQSPRGGDAAAGRRTGCGADGLRGVLQQLHPRELPPGFPQTSQPN